MYLNIQFRNPSDFALKSRDQLSRNTHTHKYARTTEPKPKHLSAVNYTSNKFVLPDIYNILLQAIPYLYIRKAVGWDQVGLWRH